MKCWSNVNEILYDMCKACHPTHIEISIASEKTRHRNIHAFEQRASHKRLGLGIIFLGFVIISSFFLGRLGQILN